MIRFLLQRRNTLVSGFLSSLLLLSACATTTPKGDNIEKRATARWDTLLSDDLAGAYEYLSPGFRSSVTSTQYQRSILLKRVKWTDARYIESDCAETTCKVTISIDYLARGVLPGVKSFKGTQTIQESWVLSDGQWYLVPEK